MKFEKVRLILLRLKLRNSGFYEDVSFKDKLVEKSFKKSVAKWMLNLHRYKEIQVDKFKDLFSELREVVFPITINYCHGSSYSLSMEFIDSNGHIYHMVKKGMYDYKSLEEYLIARRDSQLEPFVDREFHYKICEDKTIKLIKSSAMKLDEYGFNDEFVVYFHYNDGKQTIKAILKSYKTYEKIKIEYPAISDEFDKKVLEYLFSISKISDYYYDVFPMLKWITAQISDKNASISIVAGVGEDTEEISSEIQVVNGIVKKHTFTKVIDEREVRKFSILMDKDLNTFLKENV